MKKRVKRKKRIFPVLLYLSIFLLVLGIFFLIYFVLFSSFFNLKKIEVKLDKVNCVSSQDILNASQIVGKNIFFIKGDFVENNLKRKYLCIRSVNLNKQLPDRAVLTVSGRVALANLLVLRSEATDSAEVASISGDLNNKVESQLLVDSEGVIFDKGNIDVTKLYVGGKGLKVGFNLPPGVVKNAVDILSGLKLVNVNITSAIIYSNNYLYTESNPKTIFDLNKPPNRQLASLQLILAKLKIDNRKVDSIDLRFENPIVKFSKEKN